MLYFGVTPFSGPSTCYVISLLSATDCAGDDTSDTSYNVTVAFAASAAASASVTTYLTAYMSTGSTSNITRTFFAQAQSATEYASNFTTAVGSTTSSSEVAANCAQAVSFATTALQSTKIDIIYTGVSLSYFFVASAVTSAASSVALIQTNTYITSYIQTYQSIYSDDISEFSSSTNQRHVSPPLGGGATTVVPATPSGDQPVMISPFTVTTPRVPLLIQLIIVYVP